MKFVALFFCCCLLMPGLEALQQTGLLKAGDCYAIATFGFEHCSKDQKSDTCNSEGCKNLLSCKTLVYERSTSVKAPDPYYATHKPSFFIPISLISAKFVLKAWHPPQV